MRSILLSSIALIALAACGGSEPPPAEPTSSSSASVATPTAPAIAEETARLNAWFDEKYEEQLLRSPISLTQLGRKEKYDQVDDMSEAAQLADLEWRRSVTQEMEENFDYDLLTPEAQTSYDLWKLILERAEEGWKWRNHGYIFEQMGGWQTYPADFLIAFHRVDTEEDAIAFVKRIDGFAVAMNELIDQAEAAAEMDIRPPKFAYRGALIQAQNLVKGAPFDDGEDNSILSDFKTKVAYLVDSEGMPQERADELIADAETALTGAFADVYNRLIEWLETDIENADESFGVSKLPDGKAFYDYRLASSTTTDLTADEVHQIGLDEVARIRSQMEAIKEEFGFEGSLQDFFVFLRDTKDDERLYFPDTDEGRQGYIDGATYYIDNIKEQLPNYFGLLPKADVVVKRVEPYREQDGAAQHYNAGTPDGSRPGVYYAHLSDMTAMPKRELEVIAYHEALPGHHMQISIAQELTDIPQFRTQQFYTAYVEGWALYSEWLAKEMPGTYQDSLSEFGRLGSEIWRAIRLVVDTGLHTKGWTKEQAIAYFKENSAITDAQAVAEVERYITWPGQATGYKIGMIKIQELRAKAEEELGPEFDIRGFHDAILGGGGLPLDLLEKRVDRWVQSEIDAE
ncbi:MAG: DUF885 domain-containing protein [Ponticaulis sp.]|nr:DUF885 domain-containing protein [Ponticaulis sp.]